MSTAIKRPRRNKLADFSLWCRRLACLFCGQAGRLHHKSPSCYSCAAPKQAVIDLIERMPEDASVEDIMAELYFRRKVDDGLRKLDAGEGIAYEEARRRLGKWLT